MTTRTPKAEFDVAFELVTRYLAMRDHSRFELSEKLSQKFPVEIVQRVLTEADVRGWLADDASLAEHACEVWRQRLKSHGYIEEHLRKRQLPVPALDPELEVQIARELVEKKFGPAHELGYEDKSKAYRFMQYRGFDDQTIRTVLNGFEI